MLKIRRTIARLRFGAIWTMGRSSVPKGAEGSSPSALPRLCAAATASSYRRCNTGEEGGELLLEYASRGRSWQRLLEVPYEPKGLTTGDYYYCGFRTGAGARPPSPNAHASHLPTLGASVRSGSSSSRPSS